MSEEKEQEIILDEDEGGIEEKIKKIQNKLKQCQQEKKDNLAGWQRAQADFINFRRRQEEQISEWSKMFGDGLLRDILPVLDALDASIVQGGEGSNGSEAIREQLAGILSKHGLAEIKSIGEKFNHDWHEAVETVDAEETREGVVMEEVQKGYLLNGKVIRPAKVKVSK